MDFRLYLKLKEISLPVKRILHSSSSVSELGDCFVIIGAGHGIIVFIIHWNLVHAFRVSVSHKKTICFHEWFSNLPTLVTKSIYVTEIFNS